MFLTFLAPILGLATSLAGSVTGQRTATHYIGLVANLLLRGTQSGLNVNAELKVILEEMQRFVAEGRSATNEEMEASSRRLHDAIAAALAHDTSTHPSVSPGSD